MEHNKDEVMKDNKQRKSSTNSNISRTNTFWTLCNLCTIMFEYSKDFINKRIMCRQCRLPFVAVEVPTPDLKQYMRTCSYETFKKAMSSASDASSNLPTFSAKAAEGNLASTSSRTALKRTKRQKKEGASTTKNEDLKVEKNSLRSMLIRKAKFEIKSKLEEWENQTRAPVLEAPLFEIIDADSKGIESMGLPHANFHNFADDRVEGTFLQNQIWAMYDDDDRMPRNYALVHNIISEKPLILETYSLNYESTFEFGWQEWLGYGFPKTIGNFRYGNCIISQGLDHFSHMVKWTNGPSGEVQILPQKGDIWALYKNWSFNWNLNTQDDVIHVYEIVEVLEGYSIDKGVLVSPLVKVAGFKSIFRQIPKENLTWTIPKEEMLRFSHQISYFHLNALAYNIFSKGFYELDPAALPMGLRSIIEEDEENEAAKDILSRYQRILGGL